MSSISSMGSSSIVGSSSVAGSSSIISGGKCAYDLSTRSEFSGRIRYVPIDKNFRRLQRGDHILFQGLVAHHAIVEFVDVKGGKLNLIEFTGEIPSTAKITKSAKTFGVLEKGAPIYIVEYQPNETLSVEETIEKAYSALGKGDYGLLNNNCEHFATWCKTGHPISNQASDAKITSTTSVAASSLASSCSVM